MLAERAGLGKVSGCDLKHVPPHDFRMPLIGAGFTHCAKMDLENMPSPTLSYVPVVLLLNKWM